MTFQTSKIRFRDRRGLPVWPDGARMAVLVYTAPEQWLWDQTETIKPAGTFAGGRNTGPSLSTRTAVAYGFEIGLPRLREIYADYGMKVTLLASGAAVEQYPDIIRELSNDGHEFGAHGYSQGPVIATLTRQEQEAAISRTTELLERGTGVRPSGWLSPGAESNEDTVELLARAGFKYHGDMQDDELPYFVHVDDRRLVEIPYRLAGNLNDLALLTRNVNSVSRATQHLIEAFDAYYKTAAETPLMFNYGTHPYISGRPDNAQVLRGLLDHVHSHSDVWVTNYGQIAAWWDEQFGDKVAVDRSHIDVSGLR